MSSRKPPSLHSLSSPSGSRNPSIISQNAQHHAPLTPSGLRESHTLARSPEDVREDMHRAGVRTAPSSSEPSPNTYPTHVDTELEEDEGTLDGKGQGLSDLGSKAVTETTALLRKPFEF